MSTIVPMITGFLIQPASAAATGPRPRCTADDVAQVSPESSSSVLPGVNWETTKATRQPTTNAALAPRKLPACDETLMISARTSRSTSTAVATPDSRAIQADVPVIFL